MSSEDRGGSFVVGFLLGGLVGAAAALLLSPRSGEETRGTLRETGIELKVRAEEVAAKAKEEADDLLTRGRTVFDEQRGRVMDAVEEGREAAAQKRADLLSRYRISKETGEVPPETPPETPPSVQQPESGA